MRPKSNAMPTSASNSRSATDIAIKTKPFWVIRIPRFIGRTQENP